MQTVLICLYKHIVMDAYHIMFCFFMPKDVHLFST